MRSTPAASSKDPTAHRPLEVPLTPYRRLPKAWLAGGFGFPLAASTLVHCEPSHLSVRTNLPALPTAQTFDGERTLIALNPVSTLASRRGDVVCQFVPVKNCAFGEAGTEPPSELV